MLGTLGAIIRTHRFVVFVISFLLSVTATYGQTYVFGKATVSIGPGAFSAASGDFNGDGIVDLVSANQGNNTVSVVLGNTQGGFSAPATYTTGPAPTAVVTGDFNNDGILDLAVTDANCAYQVTGMALSTLICDGGTVSILLGNGDGSFQSHIDYATGKAPAALVAADFNNDGKLDLAIANSQDSSISVLLGQGDGTFQPQVVYQGVEAASLAIGDFNNDGKLDLVTPGPSVMLGNGDGTFRTPITSTGGSSTALAPLAVADFNLDGKLDLFQGGGLFLGNGDGTFVLHATYGYPSTTGSPIPSAVTGDLNGDGKPDLVVASGSEIAIFLGNGDGSFQPTVDYAAGPDSSDVLLADVNGDGRLDLAVPASGCLPFSCSTTAPSTLFLALGVGDGTFLGGVQYPFQNNNDYPATQIATADFNGDGKPDLAAETNFAPQPTSFGVFLGKGNGALQAQISTPLLQDAGPIGATDLNADGKADIATIYLNCNQGNTNCLPGDAAVFISNGDGTFQPPVDYTIGLQPVSLTTGDFNGDSKADLATANTGSSTISILLNNGDGTFQTHVDYSTGLNPIDIISGDFNGDGKLDLVTLTETGISVHLGNGDGTFRPHMDYAVATVGLSLAAGDFNGDGKLDLVLTTNGTPTPPVQVLLGNGDGTFQAPMNSAGGGGLLSVGDFNGDSKLDLVVAPTAAGAAAILLGNGDGTFAPPIPTFLAAGTAAVVDLNHDGIPDIAAGTGYNTTASEVSVLLSTPFKAVAPASLWFASQGVGTTSAPQTITLSNPAGVGFNITNIAASGEFSQTNDCGASLAAGAHCTITVRFSPTSTGSESGAITITDSTPSGPVAIPLSGTGVNGPALTANPARVIFPPQNVGTSSQPLPITLVNTGNSTLNINGVSLAGQDPSDFAQTNNCGSSLAAAASCTVNVTFAPNTGGSRTAGITVSGTEPGSPQFVPLVGTALGAAATVSPTALSFAAQTVGTTSTAETATLTNSGNAPLNITGITASADFAQTNTCGTSLAAGSSCQISVSFSPSAAGNATGSITITQSGGKPVTVALSGIGLAAPDFTVGSAPGSQTSQTIAAGQSATFGIAVAPTGSFTGTVNLSCSITPAANPAPACSLSSSAVQLSGDTPLIVTATITTAANTSQLRPPLGGAPVAWTAVLLGALLPWRRKRPFLIAIAFIAFAGMSITGCGGGGSSSAQHTTTTSGTPAGTYTATVTATSGALNHNTTVTVIVQ